MDLTGIWQLVGAAFCLLFRRNEMEKETAVIANISSLQQSPIEIINNQFINQFNNQCNK